MIHAWQSFKNIRFLSLFILYLYILTRGKILYINYLMINCGLLDQIADCIELIAILKVLVVIQRR